MQVFISNQLDLLNLLNMRDRLDKDPPSEAHLKALKRSGFYGQIALHAGRSAVQMRQLLCRFETLDSEESAALLEHNVELTTVDHKQFRGKSMVPPLVAAEAQTAYEMGLKKMQVCVLQRDGHEEWALIGKFNDGKESRTFLIGRWGVAIEPVPALITRMHREREEVARVQREEKLREEKDAAKARRRRKVRRVASQVRAVAATVAGLACIVGLMYVLLSPSGSESTPKQQTQSVISDESAPKEADTATSGDSQSYVPLEKVVPINDALTGPILRGVSALPAMVMSMAFAFLPMILMFALLRLLLRLVARR